MSRDARSNPGRAGWSDRQRTLFLRASSAAGWNDRQRYIAMRHAGCPNASGRDAKGEARPSIKCGRNTNAVFEQVMAIAEGCAALEGRAVPPPREFASWRDAAASGRHRLVNLARCIVAEAIERVPEEFNAGLERYIVEHTTEHDAGDFRGPVDPVTFDEIDGGQAHRVVEALRAFVGRRFDARGMTPRTFEIPASVKRRRQSAA